ncbi:MAG: C10 family peptidase [Candidatus Delongbacteria bacterium]
MLRTSLSLSLLLVGIGAAAPVDAPRAAAAAQALLSARGGSVLLESLQPLAPAPDGQPALWLATFQGGGFVLLRGDDRLPPVAAWSETGAAPWPTELPALLDWLELQRLDAEWARAHSWSHPAALAAWQALEAGQAAREGETVDPLLTSTWDQGWPYNQYCPADPAGPGGHVWSGCVATAMAQIMNFWEWPDTGAGSHSYVHPTYGSQSASFETTTYNWAAMPDDAGTPAGALLQYHCGVAVEMDYAPDGSGAYVGTGWHNALLALENHFRYPAVAEFIQHTQFPGAAWATRLSQEINAGRPVLDSGYGSGGHAFVLDGLQDGLFHLNWGWSGWFNGWFEIEALTPGGMEFSIQQGAIVRLERDTPPVVQVPDQLVESGQAFAVIQLDACGTDPQEEPGALDWWVEVTPPITTEFNAVTRSVRVLYPAGWTGAADLSFCALDPQGLYACDTARFSVLPGSLVPAAVTDLRLSPGPLGTRLDWTAPVTDASGLWPVQVTGYAVHGLAQPWYQPGPTSLRATLPAGATSWTDSPAAGPLFYRVVVLGE